jgi:cobalt-zinc-cadmium efflux system membrane fusion protein
MKMIRKPQNEMSSILRRLLLAAVGITSVFSGMNGTAYAGPEHDHGNESAATIGGDGPKRQPDGSVFLPKPAQRQIGVITTPAVAGELSRAIELSGKVVMDPNAGGRVQPTQAGRIEPGPRGLPGTGFSVRRGDILAYVAPSVGTVERANQLAQLAEMRAARALAEKRVARLRELSDTVPRKDIEVAESEVASLAARIAAIGSGLASREALVAPVSGVIASSHVVSGQVVDARELLFEIVDPTRLRIEALSYDADLVSSIATATLALGTERVPLRFVGSSRILREQALSMTFQAEGAALSRMAVGQPVSVFVQTTRKVAGFSVPAASLMKNPSNQTVVWVKTAPERFAPRVVATEVLDGRSVAVTSGLKAGDRVVTQAATLINQIR